MPTLTPGQHTELLVEDSAEPRLDAWLAKTCEGLSRSAAARLIDDGNVRVNGEPSKASYKLQLQDKVTVLLPSPKPTHLTAQEIPLHIYFQDAHLAVIEKPAGLVVHPAVGHEDGTLVNALLHHMPEISAGQGIGGELRPGIVHRIDRQTSGVLLVTKTDLAHRNLSQQFKEHSITRRYLGLAWGKLPPQGEWNAPLGRDPKERKRMAIVPEGRRAITRYKALEHFRDAATFFEAELLTGRTHQVRVHFAAHAYPLAGDDTYATAYRAARNKREAGYKLLRRASPETTALLESLDERKRQFLHAAHLGFTHPVSGERLEFASPLAPELEEIMVSLRACRL
jgi:23S rRNA pseudouridine1911/1915/1917 synthase